MEGICGATLRVDRGGEFVGVAKLSALLLGRFVGVPFGPCEGLGRSQVSRDCRLSARRVAKSWISRR